MLISGYRKGLFKVLDAVCILAALSITGWFMLPADLSVLDDYTGASLFTVVSYLFFFYVLDAYNVEEISIGDYVLTGGELAAAIIAEGRDAHFDPDVVDAFLAIQDEFKAIALRFADARD